MTAAITLFLFGAVTALLSLQLPLGSLHAPGTGSFPLLLGLVLAGLALAEAVRLRLSRPKTPAAQAPREDSGMRVLGFMGAVAMATALLRPLGYFGVSFLLMLALLRGLGVGWRASGLIAFVTALACELVFVYWLSIPLPAGAFGN
jgi:putative tricarboxylic transport membrane protein